MLKKMVGKVACAIRRQPQSEIAADVNPIGKAAKSTLMRKLMKKKGVAGRAAKVSVEGRGITL